MLTPKEVEAEVEKIRAMAGDDEAAHWAEDELHQRVLAAIAEGQCAEPATCAAVALKTQDIMFARWCA